MILYSWLRIKPLYLVQIKLHLSNYAEFLKSVALSAKQRMTYIQGVYLMKSSFMKKKGINTVFGG